MFPIADDVPRRHTPLVTWGLIALNLLVFGFEVRLSVEEVERLFATCGIVPSRFAETDWASPAVYATFLTSQFLHGDWLHVIVNMWTLWIFGDNVEDRMGSPRFLGFFLLCGLVAGLAHLLSDPGSDVPAIGASGAIAGVCGAYFGLFPRARVIMVMPIFVYPLFFQLPATVYLGFWFLLQFVNGVALAGGEGGIAWWAHIGGFVAGLALCWFFLSPPARERRRRRAASRAGHGTW